MGRNELTKSKPVGRIFAGGMGFSLVCGCIRNYHVLIDFFFSGRILVRKGRACWRFGRLFSWAILFLGEQ
jgi:hypothetical protein